MARAAVRGGHRMIDGLAGCRGAVVAGGAGLRHRVEERVIENTTHVESRDAMACHAVHVRRGMGLCHPDRVDAIVAGGATARNGTVVDICRQECVCRVTEAALSFSRHMPRIHARGRRSIVASGAGTDIGGMVEAAARQEIQEMIGIVALLARLGRRDMEYRFAYGQNPVVAFAAASKDFLMIDRENRGKPQWRMTGLAGIACREVIRRFIRNLLEVSTVADLTVGRQSLVIEAPRGTFSFIGHNNGSDATRTGLTFGANDQLYRVDAFHVGDEVGGRRSVIP